MTPSRSARRAARCGPWLILLASSVAAGTATTPAATPPTVDAGAQLAVGEAIYRRGTLPSGQEVRATVQGDVPLSGAQAACASCHRRSGLGSNEGRSLVAPVVGDLLYRPVTVGVPGSGRLRSEGPGTRPAYTDAALARAVREGVDPTGRTLDPLMPRFALDDEHVAALIVYLKSLSAQGAPGVTDTAIHFATVVADGIEPRRREAWIGIMDAYLRDKNGGSRNEEGRRAHGPGVMRREYQAYRKWEIHVWELRGAPVTWGAQLAELYRRQPVFAILGGIAPGSWQPVHEFSEKQQVPCLFPITDEPVDAESDFYTMYFSRGLALEAGALARHLTADPALRGKTLLQVSRAGNPSAAPTVLRRGLAGSGVGTVTDVAIEEGVPPTASFWRDLLRRDKPDIVVAWLSASELGGLDEAARELPPVERIYLSASLLGESAGALLAPVRDRVFLTYPFELPDPLETRLARMHAWMRLRGIPRSDDRVQASAFFVLTTAGEALMEMRGYFSRDYFIERIEHMIDSSVTSAVYPRLTLSPGARFASQGCYIVRTQGRDPARLVAVSDWIVP